MLFQTIVALWAPLALIHTSNERIPELVMEFPTPLVRPPSEEPQSTIPDPPSTIRDTGKRLTDKLFILFNLKAPNHEPRPEGHGSTNLSVPNIPSPSEPSTETSRRSHRVSKLVGDQQSEMCGVEVYKESSRPSATSYASTQSYSSASNTFDETNNSVKTSSDLSSVNSIVHDYGTEELEKDFLVARTMKLSQKQDEDWYMIEKRLDNTFLNLFQPPRGDDRIFSGWEFTFAGKRGSVLTPTVIITCCNESQKSQYVNILKDLPWLAKSGYPWKVVVGRIVYCSDFINVAAVLSIALGSAVTLIFIVWLMLLHSLPPLPSLYHRRSRYTGAVMPATPARNSAMRPPEAQSPGEIDSPLRVESGSTDSNSINVINRQSVLVQNSRCATTDTTSSAQICRYLEVLISVKVLSSAANGCEGSVQAPSALLSFTIGGIIRINGSAFGLTTQHALRDLAESLSNEEQGAIGRVARGANKHVAQLMERSSTQQQPTINSGGGATERRRSVLMPPKNGRQDDTRSQLDWALIAFDNEEICDLRNNTFLPNRSQNVSVSSIAHTNEFEDCDVLIPAGKSGLVSGWLRSSPVTIQSQNGVVEARQIILDRPLGRMTKDSLKFRKLTFLVPGDSGSWVLKDNKLYGHIFARRTASPVAYMLPIESIFDDIRRCLNANDIDFEFADSDEIWWE